MTEAALSENLLEMEVSDLMHSMTLLQQGGYLQTKNLHRCLARFDGLVKDMNVQELEFLVLVLTSQPAMTFEGKAKLLWQAEKALIAAGDKVGATELARLCFSVLPVQTLENHTAYVLEELTELFSKKAEEVSHWLDTGKIPLADVAEFLKVYKCTNVKKSDTLLGDFEEFLVENC